MKKHFLFTFVILLFTSLSFAQKTAMTFKKESKGKKEVQVFVTDGEKSISSELEKISAPDDIKEAIIADFNENYVAGQDYLFSEKSGDTSYSLEINNHGDQYEIQDHYGVEPRVEYRFEQMNPMHLSRSQAYLGVDYGAFDYKADQSRKNVRGVLVNDVVEGEAAYNAGVEKGDVITKINEMDTPSLSLFQDAVSSLEPRDKVTFTINRNGRVLQLESIAGKKTGMNHWVPDSQTMHPFYFQEHDMGELLNGLDIDDDSLLKLMPSSQVKLGVGIEEDSEGVKVVMVEEDSAAAQAGLEKGDIITKVDKESIQSPEELIALIQSKSEGDKVKIDFLRNGKKKSVTAQLKKSKTKMYFFKDNEFTIEEYGSTVIGLIRKPRHLCLGFHYFDILKIN